MGKFYCPLFTSDLAIFFRNNYMRRLLRSKQAFSASASPFGASRLQYKSICVWCYGRNSVQSVITLRSGRRESNFACFSLISPSERAQGNLLLNTLVCISRANSYIYTFRAAAAHADSIFVLELPNQVGERFLLRYMLFAMHYSNHLGSFYALHIFGGALSFQRIWPKFKIWSWMPT